MNWIGRIKNWNTLYKDWEKQKKGVAKLLEIIEQKNRQIDELENTLTTYYSPEEMLDVKYKILESVIKPIEIKSIVKFQRNYPREYFESAVIKEMFKEIEKKGLFDIEVISDRESNPEGEISVLGTIKVVKDELCIKRG